MPSRVAHSFLFALLLVGLTCAAAQGQDDYRAILGNRAGIFPGSEYKRVFRFPKATVVNFETAASPAAVAAFYKKDMVARGWAVKMDTSDAGTAFLVLTRKGRRCIVEARRGRFGRTGYSVSL